MPGLKRIGLVVVGVLVGYALAFATIAPVRAQRGQAATPGRFTTRASDPIVGGNLQGYYVQDTKTQLCWFVVVAGGSSPQPCQRRLKI
jgi:hypothetical protein